MLKMAYIDPATSGYIAQILFGGFVGLILFGLLIFFVVWTIIKIKKMSRQIEELKNQRNYKVTTADETHIE